MLNKPKFMTPSTNMPECVVDTKATEMPFSCIIDGNEAIFAWQVKIYTLADGDLAFDSGKQVLDKPFYPIDEKNRNVVFKIDLAGFLKNIEPTYYPAKKEYDENKVYYIRSGSSEPYTYTEYEYEENTWTQNLNNLYYTVKFENSSSPYFWTIEFWNQKDKENETSTIISCEEVFYANLSPTLTINYSTDGDSFKTLVDQTTISSKFCRFKATYDEDVELKRYGWRITDLESGQVFLDTISSGNIYGIKDNIVCSYDGFLNNGKYSIELYMETQNGYYLTTAPLNFSVNYTTTVLDNSFETEVLKEEPGVLSSWGETAIFTGVAIGDVSFKENYPVEGKNSIQIPDESVIVYGNEQNFSLDVDEDAYITLSIQLPDNKNRLVFSVIGTNERGEPISRTLSFNDGSFKYKIIKGNNFSDESTNEKCIYTPKNIPSRYNWFVITMSPFLGDAGVDSFIVVTESAALNGLYPSSTLYPSKTLYPKFGEWEVVQTYGL